jgi:hypothetical protein
MATLPNLWPLVTMANRGYQRSLVRTNQRVQLIDIIFTLWIFAYHFKIRGLFQGILWILNIAP